MSPACSGPREDGSPLLTVMGTHLVRKPICAAPLCQSLGKGLAFTILGAAKGVRKGGGEEDGRAEEEGDGSAVPQGLLWTVDC